MFKSSSRRRERRLKKNDSGINHWIVDFDRVLSRQPGHVSLNEMADLAHTPRGEFATRYWMFRGIYEEGCSALAYWSRVLDRTVTSQDGLVKLLIAADTLASTQLDFSVLNALEDAHSTGIGLTLTSAAPHEQARAIRRFKVLNHFTNMFFSSELGLLKADPLFYPTVLELISAGPGQTSIIDTAADNLATARLTGMHTREYRQPTDLAVGIPPDRKPVEATQEERPKGALTIFSLFSLTSLEHRP